MFYFLNFKTIFSSISSSNVYYFVAYCLESSAFMPPVVHGRTGYLYSAWILFLGLFLLWLLWLVWSHVFIYFFSTVGKKNKTTPCWNVSCFPLQEAGSPVEPRGRVSQEPQYQERWTAEQFRQTCRDCIQAIPARCVCVLASVERARVSSVAWITSPPRLQCFPSRFPAWVLAERSGPADGAVVLFSPLRRPLVSDIQGTEATPDACSTLRYSVSPGWDCGRPRRGGSGECACRRSSTWMIEKRLH